MCVGLELNPSASASSELRFQVCTTTPALYKHMFSMSLRCCRCLKLLKLFYRKCLGPRWLSWVLPSSLMTWVQYQGPMQWKENQLNVNCPLTSTQTPRLIPHLSLSLSTHTVWKCRYHNLWEPPPFKKYLTLILFFVGGYIRLVQMAVAMAHIRHVSCELYPGLPVLFCGDFNSTPSTGVYHFVTNGSISEDHEDWASSGEKERCSMSLSHLFKLKSACGEPAYTNYVGCFHGCLDYIFIDLNALEVEQVIPLPSHEEVTTHQALPSVSHPSDHIALVCDLKWK